MTPQRMVGEFLYDITVSMQYCMIYDKYVYIYMYVYIICYFFCPYIHTQIRTNANNWQKNMYFIYSFGEDGGVAKRVSCGDSVV